MKRIRFVLFILALGCAGIAHAGSADYRFDTVHTQVLFSVSHIGLTKSNGMLRVKSGFIHFDGDDWSKSAVDVFVDATSVELGNANWNAKIRSGEFLDSDKYATLHYVSKSVEKTGDRTGVVHGTLTMLGVSKPVDLAVTYNRSLVDPYTFHRTIGFSATATLRREDFGMKKYLPDVGNDVGIHIEAEGVRDRDAQEQADKANQEK